MRFSFLSLCLGSMFCVTVALSISLHFLSSSPLPPQLQLCPSSGNPASTLSACKSFPFLLVCQASQTQQEARGQRNSGESAPKGIEPMEDKE